MFMGVCLEQPDFCILTELVARGSLFDILRDEVVPISWNLILRMATDIAEVGDFFYYFERYSFVFERDRV